jgi:hypothetical protein
VASPEAVECAEFLPKKMEFVFAERSPVAIQWQEGAKGGGYTEEARGLVYIRDIQMRSRGGNGAPLPGTEGSWEPHSSVSRSSLIGQAETARRQTRWRKRRSRGRAAERKRKGGKEGRGKTSGHNFRSLGNLGL